MAKSVSAASPNIGSTQMLILLQSIPHLGDKTLARLLGGSAQRRLTPEELVNLPASVLQNELQMDPRSAEYLTQNRTALLEQSAQTARMMRSYPLQLLCTAGAAYPARLQQYAEDPPPLIYALGNVGLLDEAKPKGSDKARFTFTIAASRGAAAATLTLLDEMATQLAARGGVPVTGHDRPEYQRLALAAQRRDLPAIYVFDRGLKEALGPQFDRPPFAAARIRDAVFVHRRDLAISPFRLDDHCVGSNNRRRDALIFALSDLVIALDIRAEGAMYDGCARSLRQGRSVVVVSGGRPGNDALRDLGAPEAPGNLADIVL